MSFRIVSSVSDDFLKGIVTSGQNGSNERFADTKDTLCYATNDNQSAVSGMLETEADLAIVVGGYNSSNTSHLVELCELKLPTYYIEDHSKILQNGSIQHFELHHHSEKISENFIPKKDKVKILLTSGASCPDAVVENVIRTLLDFFPNAKSMEDIMKEF